MTVRTSELTHFLEDSSITKTEAIPPKATETKFHAHFVFLRPDSQRTTKFMVFTAQDAHFHVFTNDGARKFTQFTFSRFSRCTKFTKFTFSRFHGFHGARNSRNSRFHVFTFFTVHEIHVFMFSRFRAHEKFTKFTFSCFFTFHPLCMRRPCEGLRNLKKQSGSFQHVVYIYYINKYI